MNTSCRADIAQLVEQRIRNAKVVGSTPIIGTIFSNKIIWLLLHCFAFLNTNVHFCALWVWQNCGRYSEIVCGPMQGYANSMSYLEAPLYLVFWAILLLWWLLVTDVDNPMLACTDGSKRCHYKSIHSNTFSSPFRYLHSWLTTCILLSHVWQKSIQYPAKLTVSFERGAEAGPVCQLEKVTEVLAIQAGLMWVT